MRTNQFDALDAARGGNDIPVVAFVSPTCTRSDGTSTLCTLHGIWDTTLIAHRHLSDREYLDALAKQALLPGQGVVEERLALGGLRLAAVLNQTRREPPPR